MAKSAETKKAAIVLLIIQIVLNGVLSFSLYFQPAFYMALIISLPKKLRPAFSLIIAFMTGLFFDIISSGVWGVNSAAATAALMLNLIIRPKIFGAETDSKEEVTSRQQILRSKYFIYILFITATFSFVYIMLDNPGFKPVELSLYRFGISTFVNAIVIWDLFLLFNLKGRDGNRVK